MDYTSAPSKAVAVARMYALGGRVPEPLGPGSKEKRSAFDALASFLGLDLSAAAGKPELGRLLADHLGVTWDDSCYSAGGTVTLVGVNRLVDATVTQRLIPPSDDSSAQRLHEVMSAGPGGDQEPASQQPPEDLAMSDESSEIEQNIAEYIAALSEPAPVPTGVLSPPELITANDVRFVDGSWRQRLIDVQGWLNLPTPLDVSSPEAFAESLSAALWSDRHPEPSPDALLPRLQERLDKAKALRERFIELMDSTAEGNFTQESATQEWVRLWEEVTQQDEAEESGPIHATATTWSISQFVQYAEDGELELSPSYQRADVWPTSDAQMLIESILRGIPLPSVIILERQEDIRTLYEVVDGKQRLTSILRFMGAHPRAIALVKAKEQQWNETDLVDIFKTDYPRFKRLWNKHEPERLTAAVERTNYFPFALRGGDVKPLSGKLARFRGKYYSEIWQEHTEVQGTPRKVLYIFEKQATYQVPVITYKQVTPAQVHEVFSLYNKQGKHLNAEEIRNALYHQLALMKALLVTAGDSEDVKEVAPFLASSWDDLASTSKTLDNYGFGRVGYKRTKILSWVAASLLLNDGRPESRSTSSHINAFLDRVAGSVTDPLRDKDRVKTVMAMLDRGIDAHASVEDGWAPGFKNAQHKGKWQELQLVASLIGMCAASAVLGDDLEDAAEASIPRLLEVSRTWKRPGKTQSREQWLFIRQVVEGVLGVLDVDPAAAHRAMETRFGSSGLSNLLTADD